jgi:AcrR family transcriptional regulator
LPFKLTFLIEIHPLMFSRKPKIEVDAREALIQTASRLFAEHGFEAVSTRMLSKEAGVNIAMIAYYFGSKEKLFEAIVDERLPKSREMLLGFLESDLQPWEKLSAIINHYVEKIFNDSSFTKLIYRELSLQQRPAHRERILNGILENWEIMSKIIEEGQNKGVFRKDIDVIMTLNSIFGTISQMVNTPAISTKILQKANDNDVFDEETKIRLKSHLNQMVKSHLLVNP